LGHWVNSQLHFWHYSKFYSK